MPAGTPPAALEAAPDDMDLPHHDGKRGELMASATDRKRCLSPDTQPDSPNSDYRKLIYTAIQAAVERRMPALSTRGAPDLPPSMGKAHMTRIMVYQFCRRPGTNHLYSRHGLRFCKSTRPFYETFKEAIVDVIDLSAPV